MEGKKILLLSVPCWAKSSLMANNNCQWTLSECKVSRTAGTPGPASRNQAENNKNQLFHVCPKGWKISHQSHLWTLPCLRCATHPSCFYTLTSGRYVTRTSALHMKGPPLQQQGNNHGRWCTREQPPEKKGRGREGAWGHALHHLSSLQPPHRRQPCNRSWLISLEVSH